MEESTVLYEYDEDLTVNSRTAGAHRKRRHVSQAYYIFLSLKSLTSRSPAGSVKQIQNIYSLCSQCGHCNHKEQQFPVVESNILRVFDEKGY